MNNDWWDYLAHSENSLSKRLFTGKTAAFYKWSPKAQAWIKTSVSDSELTLSPIEIPNYQITYVSNYGKQAAPYWYMYLNRHIIVLDGGQPLALHEKIVQNTKKQKQNIQKRMKENGTFDNIQKQTEKNQELQAKKSQPIKRTTYKTIRKTV